jgi:hypothetical protein
MAYWIRNRWLVALAVGLLGGLLLSGFWPHTPLHAVSTDRVDTFAMATGPVDADTEAVYFLDFLTGDLRAVVLAKTAGSFSAFYQYNVTVDLGIDPQKNPKYLMATGLANLRRGGGARVQPSNAVCYVAEISTGKVAAYAIPWSPSMHAANQMQNGALLPIAITRFRPATGVGPAGPAVPAGEKKPAKGAKRDTID